jgi:hypothetical protein
MPTGLDPETLDVAPRVARTPRRFRESRPSAPPEALHERVGDLRREAIDLVCALRERDERRWGEYERASEGMQSVANQLGSLQALVARAERA